MKSLRLHQRQAIASGIRAGKSNAQIAREIGVHRATVGREIARNADSREAYAALQADELSWQRKQDAVKRHQPVQFGGVAYFTELQQHHRFYSYLSKNHYSDTHTPADYFPTPWDPAYVRRYEQLRLMPDCSYQRLRLRFQLWNTSDPVHLPLLVHPLQQAMEALQEGERKWRTIFLEIQTDKTLSVPREPVTARQRARKVVGGFPAQAPGTLNNGDGGINGGGTADRQSVQKVVGETLPQASATHNNGGDE